MCGLAQLHLLACTGKGYAHPSGKRTGADAEECQSVTVCRVHVRLNFENEAAEEIIIGVDLTCSGLSCTGSRGPFQKMVQEGRYTEIRQCRAEEYGRQLAVLDCLQIKGIACTVQKLHLATQDIQIRIRNDTLQRITEYTVCTKLNHAILLLIKINLVFQSVINAFKGQTIADGPCDSGGGQP